MKGKVEWLRKDGKWEPIRTSGLLVKWRGEMAELGMVVQGEW